MRASETPPRFAPDVTAQELADRSWIKIQTIKRWRWSKASPRAGSKHSWISSPRLEAAGIEFTGTPEDSPGIRVQVRR